MTEKQCQQCGGPVGSRNKTGLCRWCARPRGEGHYNYQGKSTELERRRYHARKRALKMYPIEGKTCDVCGAPAEQHDHLDGNPLNNRPSNISFKCHSCHARRHLKERWEEDSEYTRKMKKLLKGGIGWPRKNV